jgi:TonB family protein
MRISAMSRLFGSFTTGLLLVGVAAPSGADELDRLLAKPVSPGSLAVLIPYVKDERVQERWRTALTNPNPQVRATAARLVFVDGVVSAVPALKQALAQESDESVAPELAQALLGLARDTDEVVLAAAARVAPARLAVTLARARTHNALVYFDRLRALKLDPASVQQMVLWLVSKGQKELDHIAARAVEGADKDLWLAVLEVAHEQSLAVHTAVLQSALTSSSDLRALAWWQVAALAADGKPLPQIPASGAPLDDGTPPEWALGRELAARAMRSAPTNERTDLIAKVHDKGPVVSLPKFAFDALSGALGRFLTPAEREALETAIPTLKVAADTVVPNSPSQSPPEYQNVRTIGELPAGYAEDVLQQTGCRTSKDSPEFGGAAVTYNENGSLRQISWVANTLSSRCADAARYLTAAGLVPAPSTAQPGEKQLILLPMHDVFLKCLASNDVPPPLPTHVGSMANGSKVKAPTKIRMVNPIYPPEAQAARQQGIVVIEATVSPSGCINRAEVLKSVTIQLDAAAVRAVTGWVFTPTLLNGQPVPVIMTVTVQFTLQQ